MDLYEFEGKALLERLGIPTPKGVFCTDAGETAAAEDSIGFPCVVKSQVLTGGRGKAGGIAVVESPEELAREAARISTLEINGQTPVGLLVEALVPTGRELYAAVAFDTSTAGLVLLFSARGGVEVEEGAADLVRIPVSVAQMPAVTPAWVADRLCSTLGDEEVRTLPVGALEATARLLTNLLHASVEYDLELFEINPLIAAEDSLVAADAKVSLDDDAAFRRPEGLVLVERPLPPELEQRARAASLQFVDLDGEICLMANGAGLNLSLLDAVAAFGSTPANFLDTGGGASTAKAYAGMRILQDRSSADGRVRARLVMLSLAITRAREAAEGIAQAVTERPEDTVPTFAVVHGTGSAEGREILQAAGITVAPDIRTAVEWAATAERGV